MENQQSNPLSDKDMLTDSIDSQKHITETYNTVANECQSSQLRSTFMSILSDEHEIQADLFDEMCSRGWYDMKRADSDTVRQTKQKFVQ